MYNENQTTKLSITANDKITYLMYFLSGIIIFNSILEYYIFYIQKRFYTITNSDLPYLNVFSRFIELSGILFLIYSIGLFVLCIYCFIQKNKIEKFESLKKFIAFELIAVIIVIIMYSFELIISGDIRETILIMSFENLGIFREIFIFTRLIIELMAWGSLLYNSKKDIIDRYLKIIAIFGLFSRILMIVYHTSYIVWGADQFLIILSEFSNLGLIFAYWIFGFWMKPNKTEITESKKFRYSLIQLILLVGIIVSIVFILEYRYKTYSSYISII